MMNILPVRDSVLIISDYDKCFLSHELLRKRIMGIVKSEMDMALNTLKHGDFLTLMIDKAHAKIDLIEFVLNVRDINKEIPILIHRDIEVHEKLKPIIRDGREHIKNGNITKHQRLTLQELQSHFH